MLIFIFIWKKLQMKHSFILKWRLCFYNVLVTKVVSLKMPLYFVVILNNKNVSYIYQPYSPIILFLIETCDIRIHKYTFTDHFVRWTCLLLQSNNITWQHDQDNLLKFSIKKGKEGDSSQFECDCLLVPDVLVWDFHTQSWGLERMVWKFSNIYNIHKNALLMPEVIEWAFTALS